MDLWKAFPWGDGRWFVQHTEAPDQLLGPYSMQDAEMEMINPVTARVTGTGSDGTEHVVVLDRRGTWKIHVSTLNGGEPVTDVWYSVEQSRFGGRLKYTRDVTIQVRGGEFASAEEAQARLAELMSGRMPPLGSVTPD